jgi:hypothetical protein
LLVKDIARKQVGSAKNIKKAKPDSFIFVILWSVVLSSSNGTVASLLFSARLELIG